MFLKKIPKDEAEKVQKLIEQASKDSKLELEVRFGDVPCGNNRLSSFVPSITLQTFQHILQQLMYQVKDETKPVKFNGVHVSLDYIYKNHCRRTHKKTLNDGVVVALQRKKRIDFHDSKYGYRVSLALEETSDEPMDDQDLQMIRYKQRYMFLAFDDEIGQIPIWEWALTITESAYHHLDSQEKITTIIDRFNNNNNIHNKHRDFRNERYELELEYVGNKSRYMMRNDDTYKVLYRLISWIMENNQCHPVRYGCLMIDETKSILDLYLAMVRRGRYEFEIDGIDYDELVKQYAQRADMKETAVRLQYQNKQAIINALKLIPDFSVGSIRDYFIGYQPVAMIHDDMATILNEEYTVQQKVDGERNLLFVTATGHVYLVGRDMYIKKTGIPQQNMLAESLIDCEYVYDHSNGVNHIYPFDIIIYRGEDLRGKKDATYDRRIILLRSWMKEFPHEHPALYFKMDYLDKVLLFNPKQEQQPSLHACIQIALSTSNDPFPKMDGLIFRPRHACLPKSGGTWWKCFKWKAPHENTIDFLLYPKTTEDNNTKYWELMSQTTILPINVKGHEHDGIVIGRKRIGATRIFKLYIKNLGIDIERNEKDVDQRKGRIDLINFSSVVGDADLCRISEETNTVKLDDYVVVECRFNQERQKFEVVKIRWDKTMNGNANHITTAYDVWDSINNPITENYLLYETVVTNRTTTSNSSNNNDDELGFDDMLDDFNMSQHGSNANLMTNLNPDEEYVAKTMKWIYRGETINDARILLLSASSSNEQYDVIYNFGMTTPPKLSEIEKIRSLLNCGGHFIGNVRTPTLDWADDRSHMSTMKLVTGNSVSFEKLRLATKGHTFAFMNME